MIDRLNKFGVLLGNVIQFVCIPFVWWISLLDQMLCPGRSRGPAKATARSHSGHTCKAPTVMSHQDVMNGYVICSCGASLKVISGCSDASQVRNLYADPKTLLASCNTKVFFALDDQQNDGKTR
jgi:hypothetical protein